MDDYAKRFRLMCPGPVNVSERVREAMVAFEIGHREVEFSALLDEIQQNCLKIMGLDPQKYTLVVITGSGSAANEAVLTSALQPHHHVLSLATGEFGRRLGDISAIYNPNTKTFSQNWATILDLDAVENELKNHHYDWVTMVHHETSTGELLPVENVGALCKKYGAKLFVDAVSAFVVDPLNLEKANVAFMSTSSGKALCMPPGLSLVVGRIDEFETLSHFPIRNYYLSLSRFFQFAQSKKQTPNTPSVQLFFALNEAFKMILEESPENRFAFQAKKAAYFRNGLQTLGLSLLHPDHPLSNAVSTVILPDHVDFSSLRENLRQRGFIVYGGKGPLLGKVFQVSTMGAIQIQDVQDLLDALKDALHDVLHSVA